MSERASLHERESERKTIETGYLPLVTSLCLNISVHDIPVVNIEAVDCSAWCSALCIFNLKGEFETYCILKCYVVNKKWVPSYRRFAEVWF